MPAKMNTAGTLLNDQAKNMNIIIEENLVLERTAEKHAGQLLDAVSNNRAHLSKFLAWVETMQSTEDAVTYIQNSELLYQQKKELSFIIKYNDQLVGRVGLHHINLLHKLASIGYWLDKSLEGKGIIRKSCIVLINYGFEVLNLHRIEIKAAVSNHRSQAIPQKLNFKKEGILREAELVNNEFHDLVLFSMLSHEWNGGDLHV